MHTFLHSFFYSQCFNFVETINVFSIIIMKSLGEKQASKELFV